MSSGSICVGVFAVSFSARLEVLEKFQTFVVGLHDVFCEVGSVLGMDDEGGG